MPLSVRPEEPSHLVPGYRLDRYELLFPIGTGGMASVWVARQTGKHGFEKLVAIKTILPRYARDPHFQQMFLDEARIASRIHHPNVAQILDLGDHQDVLFLAMEWVEGDALSRLARAVHERGATFPPGIALRVMSDVCAGLHAAHELRGRDGVPLGIVHRDVSPHNVLLGEQGAAKVIDFGIAKARDRAAGDTDTGSFKGKVKYMAPEQALSPRSTDRRADLWSVGAVIYSLLAGHSPYESENDIATLAQLATGKPAEPLPAHLPEPLRALTARALAWKPEERFATADELRCAIERALADMGQTTTSADVAAFCAEHLAERADARRKAVVLALSAAEERSRGLRLLTPADDPSARFRPSQQAADPPAATAPSPAPVPSETSPTLGAAATMTTSPATLPGRRRWGMLAAGISAAVAATVVVAATLAHRGGAASGAAPATANAPDDQPVPPSSASSAAAPPGPPAPSGAPTASGAPVSPVVSPSAPSAAAPDRAPTPPPATHRRSPPARPSPTPSPPPAASGTTKRRTEYGF